MSSKKESLKLTIIIDNYVNIPKLKAEHGWSIIIEKGREKILFDCGQSNQIINNTNILQFNLNNINKIVLSHGHFDHTGGLLDTLKNINKKIEVFAHPQIFEKKYRINKDKTKKYIGIPLDIKTYEENGAEFILNNEEVSLGNDIYLTGQIERNNSFEEVENTFVKKNNDIFIHDSINDDISMIIDLPEGLILVLGCAHSGVINIIRQSIKITKKDEFLSIIGGFHLVNKSKDYIEKTFTELNKYKIRSIFPAHCTGLDNFNKFREYFGEIAIMDIRGKK